jgi:hypothetical protein
MNRPRLSLMGLMGTIALLAVSFAAWRIPWLPLRTSAFFALIVFRQGEQITFTISVVAA